MDDLFLVSPDAKERPVLLDIIEDRHERKSVIITSQLPVAHWYDAIAGIQQSQMPYLTASFTRHTRSNSLVRV
jgi:DNA replication protein DnaC